MGKNAIDKFTLLHMATGVIFFFISVPLSSFLVIQILFEIIENSNYGIYFISNYLHWWPGGKHSKDSYINIISDISAGTLGWLLAWFVDFF